MPRREPAAPGAATAPDDRIALLTAATAVVHEHGAGGLTVAEVLVRAQLGTRAFYRHFDSKDQLLQAVFLELARVEMRRLRRRMTAAPNPVEAVALWVEGRLALAYGDPIRADLRTSSLEARSQMFSAPDVVGPAYRETLGPLIEALERGKCAGIFADIDPVTDAELLHGAVWACVERQWATGSCDRTRTRDAALRFCLQGLGAPADLITAAVGRARR